MERIYEDRVVFSQKRSYQEKQQWFPEGWAPATDTQRLRAEGDVASPGRRVLSDTLPCARAPSTVCGVLSRTALLDLLKERAHFHELTTKGTGSRARDASS